MKLEKFENFYFELQPLQLISDIFEQIKSKLMIENLNITELVEQQDKNGRFYSFIQISDRDKTYHAFSWGDSLFRSNIQSIILCFQSLLISKKSQKNLLEHKIWFLFNDSKRIF